MKKALLLRIDDWMALYVDGQVVAQEHSFRLEDFPKMLKAHDVDPYLLKSFWANTEDEREIQLHGCATHQDDLTGEYRNWR